MPFMLPIPPALGTSGASVQVIEITTTYDAAGRPLEVSYPQSMKLDRTFNEAGSLERVRVDRGAGGGWQIVVEDSTYNARGQVTGFTHGNGVETTHAYDEDLERLSRIFTRISGTRFQDLRYSYDPAGNPVAIEDALRHDTFKANAIIPNTRHYWYDARYRLVRATGRQHATVTLQGDADVTSSPDPNDYDPYDLRYAYDEVGNFVRNTEVHGRRLNYKDTRIDLYNGDIDEATDDDPEAGNWTYDDNGACTHSPRHDELRYTFDGQPRYVDLGGGGQVHYLRNADQRVVRLLKKTGVDALGIYLGPWEYHWRDATTAYAKVVLHAEGHGRHAQVERVFDGSDPDSEDLFFVHGDHLKSGQVLTDDAGDLLSQEEYFPYGRSSDRRDARNRYRFIGVERDDDTGLCMTGPRTYDCAVGRFLQGDPIAGTRAVARTPFHYCRGSPLRRRDDEGYDDPVVTPLPNCPDSTAAAPSPKKSEVIAAERASSVDLKSLNGQFKSMKSQFSGAYSDIGDLLTSRSDSARADTALFLASLADFRQSPEVLSLVADLKAEAHAANEAYGTEALPNFGPTHTLTFFVDTEALAAYSGAYDGPLETFTADPLTRGMLKLTGAASYHNEADGVLYSVIFIDARRLQDRATEVDPETDSGWTATRLPDLWKAFAHEYWSHTMELVVAGEGGEGSGQNPDDEGSTHGIPDAFERLWFGW